MNAQAALKPAQGGVIAQAAVWGGSLVLVNVLCLVIFIVAGAGAADIVWPIVLAVVGGVAIGLGAGLPGMGKGISMLSAGVVYLVLWLIAILTSLPARGGSLGLVFLILFFILLVYVALGGGIAVQRDYPSSLAGRLLAIIASALLIILFVLETIVCIVQLTEVRGAVPIIIWILALLLTLWMLALMILSLINGIKRQASAGLRLFAMVGVQIGVGVFALAVLANYIYLWAATGAFVFFAGGLLVLSTISATYLGGVGLGDMIRQILFRMGHAPVARPAPAAAVAAPARPVQPAPAAPAETTEDRLAKLKKLFEQGNISQEEYDRRRQQILEEL